jgi:hypothetical protein
MLFGTFDPYYNDYEYLTHSKPICFICYETANAYEWEPIQLNAQLDYIKKCNCNSWIHKNCLNNWYNKSTSCPICRISISKKITRSMSILENSSNYYILINRYFLKNIYKISKFLYMILFFYYVYKIYLFAINDNYYINNNINHNNNHNNNNSNDTYCFIDL